MSSKADANLIEFAFIFKGKVKKSAFISNQITNRLPHSALQ